jgi:hypothetical protein
MGPEPLALVLRDRYGPGPSGAGIQDGTNWPCVLGEERLQASRKLSHPHPGPAGLPATTFGLLPLNPSSRPATSSRCAPQLGIVSCSNVWSEIPYCCASTATFGIWFRRYRS